MSEKMDYNEALKILDQIDTFDLINELEFRGYYIEDEDTVDISEATYEQLVDELRDRGREFIDGNLENVVYCWNRGDRKEALFLLEREVPDLRGIANIVN